MQQTLFKLMHIFTACKTKLKRNDRDGKISWKNVAVKKHWPLVNCQKHTWSEFHFQSSDSAAVYQIVCITSRDTFKVNP